MQKEPMSKNVLRVFWKWGILRASLLVWKLQKQWAEWTAQER